VIVYWCRSPLKVLSPMRRRNWSSIVEYPPASSCRSGCSWYVREIEVDVIMGASGWLMSVKLR